MSLGSRDQVSHSTIMLCTNLRRNCPALGDSDKQKQSVSEKKIQRCLVSPSTSISMPLQRHLASFFRTKTHLVPLAGTTACSQRRIVPASLCSWLYIQRVGRCGTGGSKVERSELRLHLHSLAHDQANAVYMPACC